MSLYIWSNANYRRLFGQTDIDWCKFMDGDATKASPVLKVMMEAIKESSPQIFHECPFVGPLDLVVVLEKRVILIFPKGKYKFALRVYNAEDDNLFQITIVIEK